MTQGETLFYLREIRSHWCASNVSLDKLAELESAKLIERSAEPVPTVRLTSQGAQFKASGQRPSKDSNLNLTRVSKTRRIFSPKKQVTRAKPLV
jgi:hypothetical protein